MPWLKVDDAFHSHPKVVDTDLDALGLWILAGTWSAQHLTEGLVSTRQVARLGGTTKRINKLVASGLWEVVEGGYQFHDWDDYQPSKEHVEAERRSSAERMRKLRASRKGTTGQSSDEQAENVRPNAERTSHEVQLPRPSPAQPDPALSSGEERELPRKRGSRLPSDWHPTPEVVEQMRSECPAVNLQAEHRVFADYWIAQPGQKGMKLDWEATWRNWMRRKQGDVSSRPSPMQRAQATLQLATDLDTRELGA